MKNQYHKGSVPRGAVGFRGSVAIWFFRVTSALARKVGGHGETISGNVAQLLCPDILGRLSSQVREKTIVVCGTNGKTTTSNLIAAALEAEGYKVVCNRSGANMPNGIASAYLMAAGKCGKLDADYAVIEVDEGYAKTVFPQIHPDVCVLTNLFRDQLDRYGEIDLTMGLLGKAFQEADGLTLLVNADDVLSATLAQETGKPFETYGISNPQGTSSVNEIREGRFCKRCGGKLSYRFYHFSQLGDYHCPKCGLKRPAITFDGQEVNLSPLSFDIVSLFQERGKKTPLPGERRRFHTSYQGFYNVYNILAAYGAVRMVGLSAVHFQQMLSSFHPENGRMEHFRIQGCPVTLNLAKNPAGFNQNIAAVMQDKSKKDILIVINDKEQDGRDISWLWDVDFDALSDGSVNSIRVAGIRALDMCLRLKYVDIPSTVYTKIEQPIRDAVSSGAGNLYVLVNYSALFDTHAILKRLSKGEEA